MNEIETVARVQDVASKLGAQWDMAQTASVWRVLNEGKIRSAVEMSDDEIASILTGEKVTA